MSGTNNGDELAILVASFVEEIQSFFAAIRRGVTSIFAMPRDAQAIGAARQSLTTIAASATVLDLPAARQLGELAQLVDEAFGAAERGGVPDESRAPMLTMVDDLEAQLNGLLTGDERGRERLDNGYRLLEQVLQTVEQAEAIPAPAIEIDLDDLLLTLSPAPAKPAAEDLAAPLAPAEPAPEPEPTQTELVLVAEEEVAPIEWGEKEAILWEKGGWDESQTAYGNTEWIFLDLEETAPPAPEVAQDDRLVLAAEHHPVEAVAVAETVAETMPPTGDLPDYAPEGTHPAAAARSAEAGALEDGEELVVVAPPAVGPAPALDANLLEEAALLALRPADLDQFLTLDQAGQDAFLREHRHALTHFAANLGMTVEADAAAVTTAWTAAEGPPDLADTLVSVGGERSADEGAADDQLLKIAPHPEGTRAPTIDEATAAPASQTEWIETLAQSPVDVLIDEETIPTLGEPEAIDGTDRVVAAYSAGHHPAHPGYPAEGGAAEETAPAPSVADDDTPLDAVAEATTAPADGAVGDEPGAQGDWDNDGTIALIADVLLAEYRSSAQETETPAFEANDADAIMAARLYNNRLDLPDEADDGLDGATMAGDGADARDDAGDGETETGFLDALLDEPTPREGQRLSTASEQLFGDADEPPLDPDFAAMPEVSADIEAAFARLSETDMMAFLTLDGDAAMAFLQSRVVVPEAAAPPAEVAAQPVMDGGDEIDRLVVAPSPAPETSGSSLSNLDLDPEILEVFLIEVQELLEAWGSTQQALRRAPADLATINELRRTAHTVKGAASMMGFDSVAGIGRQVEELLDTLGEQELAAAPPLLDFVERSYALLQRLTADASADPRAYAGELGALAATHAALQENLPTLGGAGVPSGPATSAPVAASPRPQDTREAPGTAPTVGAAAILVEAADDELMEIFVQEAEEHLGGFNRAVVALDRQPGDSAQLAEAKRLVHTLKGAAAALGYPVTAGLCHSIEDLFETLDQSGREPSREMITLFFESVETLEGLVTGIAAGRGEALGAVEALRARYAAFLGGRGAATPQTVPLSVVPAVQDRQAGAEDLGGASSGAEIPVPGREAVARSVRVDIAHLDNLLNLVGELVINRTSQEQNLERLAHSVNELLLSVERLRRVGFQLESRYEVAELLRTERRSPARPAERLGIHERAGRGGEQAEHGQFEPLQAGRGPLGNDEFDDLEMDRYTELHRISRQLGEVAADISAAGNELGGLYDSFDQTLARQGRISTDLQDRLMEVRLVPLSTIASRLYRAVRGVAVRRDRQVELTLAGEETEIDKVLLEEITDPLLHLVRNAADHGIESPTERHARGKPATGTVHFSATREGNEAVIRISDDGAGINLDAVLDKALARGVISRRDELTREQALDLIFLPGFSTSTTVSDISGRGVGLDVVRTNVARLKGTIDVESVPGTGTTFTLRLPIILAVMRALLVRVGTQTFALPLPVVEQVAFFHQEAISQVGGNELFDLDNETYPVVSLGRALGVGALPTTSEEVASARVLIVGNIDRRIALVVDELVGQQEVVVKRLGRHLQSVAGVAGATILGNGQIVLILNVLDLLGAPRRSVRAAMSGGAAAAGPGAAPETAAAKPVLLAVAAGDGERLAMVVDDSLSVRRVLTRTLERDGWKVVQAKDGVEALETLSWARPRVMLLDIEMPRMDGYELTSLLRANPDYRDLPIVMLTSRAGDKHRRKAFELGVSAYLVKPFEEAELLRTARELGLGQPRQTQAANKP